MDSSTLKLCSLLTKGKQRKQSPATSRCASASWEGPFHDLCDSQECTKEASLLFSNPSARKFLWSVNNWYYYFLQSILNLQHIRYKNFYVNLMMMWIISCMNSHIPCLGSIFYTVAVFCTLLIHRNIYTYIHLCVYIF